MIKLIGMFIFAIHAICAFPQFTETEIRSFSSIINKERSNKNQNNIKPVIINWNLTYALQEFIQLGGAKWGYEDTYISPELYNHYTKFHVLKTNSTFMNIIKKYQDLPKLLNNSFLDATHDTFYDSGGRHNQAIQIVKFRLNQRKCFVRAKCSETTYSNYESCSDNIVVRHFFPKPCQWFFWYYPRMIHSKVTQMAFVKLQIPGRFVGDLPQNNAWLIVFVMPNFTHVNDIPY